MNVISAIFALLGIVAFIVDLNLNGLYRSSFDYDGYLVLVSGGVWLPPPSPTPASTFGGCPGLAEPARTGLSFLGSFLVPFSIPPGGCRSSPLDAA